MWVGSLGWEDPLEEDMATHSSSLTWRIPWTEEPGRLQSMGLQRVGHNWSDLANRHACRAFRLKGWVTSGQTNKEGVQPHPSADNWIKSTALSTRADPVFPTISTSHQEACTSLSLIHQRADRRSKKNRDPTMVRTKTILQKVNQDEKAEGYVPHEATKPQKNN